MSDTNMSVSSYAEFVLYDVFFSWKSLAMNFALYSLTYTVRYFANK